MRTPVQSSALIDCLNCKLFSLYLMSHNLQVHWVLLLPQVIHHESEFSRTQQSISFLIVLFLVWPMKFCDLLEWLNECFGLLLLDLWKARKSVWSQVLLVIFANCKGVLMFLFVLSEYGPPLIGIWPPPIIHRRWVGNCMPSSCDGLRARVAFSNRSYVGIEPRGKKLRICVCKLGKVLFRQHN